MTAAEPEKTGRKQTKAADAIAAHGALVAAVADGELTPSEASDLGRLIDGYTRAVETHEILDRLAKLEASQAA
jgi:hypothetical protein